MLDTVALVLDSSMFAILDYDTFQPSARGLYHPPYTTLGARGSFRCFLNPTRADLLTGKYYPRLTLTKRAVRGGFQITLRIEFSVPKLIYGNNFDEVTDKDFGLVVDTLKERLKEKGILLRRTKIEDVPLSKVDYSKNIFLEPYSNARIIIDELNKADMHLWLDLEVAKYRNAGYGIKYRNNSFELACYDKIKDLQKGKQTDKKSEEKDNALQLNLLEEFIRPKSLDVFRIEARLNSRQKIRETYKKLGIEAEPIFSEAFSANISRAVLKHYWKILDDAYKTVEFNPNSSSKLFNEIKANNPDARLSTVLKIMGMKQLINEVGVRGFRNIANGYSKSSWQGSKRSLNQIRLPQKIWTPLSQVGSALEEFSPVSLEQYRAKVYSNSK